MGKKLDVTGEIYGNLKAIKNTERKYHGTYIWEFECLLCGAHLEARLAQVRYGSITKCKSCGRKEALKNLSTMPVEEKLGLVCGTNVSRIISDKLQRNNTTGHAGVSLHRQKGRKDAYLAYIYFGGNRYNLGSYGNIEDAIAARKTAEQALRNDFLTWYAKEHPDRWEKLNRK